MAHHTDKYTRAEIVKALDDTERRAVSWEKQCIAKRENCADLAREVERLLKSLDRCRKGKRDARGAARNTQIARLDKRIAELVGKNELLLHLVGKNK